ncbi:MAG TPA: S53 family peptidase [Candidatus Baltobacteraceae bacterium]|jgi:kumamolisin|nr:S53 family peptidase [Candidatus Baltobacteraceae bacterium]
MSQRWTVPGSQRTLPASTRVLGDADPNAESTVTLIVRSKQPQTPPPGAMSREAFAREYGADDADLKKVQDFARAHGLSVVECSAGRRSVVLRGTVSQMSAAFGVHLKRCETGGVTFRGREGSLSVPAELEGIVEAVLGLDDRPQASPRVRIAAQPQASFTPVQVASLYDFPAGVTGTGQCIAILELGGGFTQTDYDTYLSSLGVNSQSVAIVSVDGGRNAPGEDSDADVEVMMDAEIAGAVAPGASLAIYFAPNTDQGFVDAVTTAVHDSTHKPSVISISWGAPEPNWTQQARTALNSAIAAAASVGVTVCVASGDGGSSDGLSDGQAHADFPCSSPYALGCGGTTLSATGSRISAESAWDDSGGGVSSYFALPQWQAKAGVPPPPAGSTGGRGVPDVSADADPNSGYRLRVDGSEMVAAGTSAAAPLWAALVALMNQQLGHNLGFVNASLYAVPGYPNSPGPLHDITSGSNGAYKAGPGWDPCTGLGSPDGGRLSQALGAKA